MPTVHSMLPTLSFHCCPQVEDSFQAAVAEFRAARSDVSGAAAAGGAHQGDQLHLSVRHHGQELELTMVREKEGATGETAVVWCRRVAVGCEVHRQGSTACSIKVHQGKQLLLSVRHRI